MKSIDFFHERYYCYDKLMREMRNTKAISLMTPEKMQTILDSNNITREKSELYCWYIKSLLVKMFDTYLGDDITSKAQRKHHFKWCWNQNVSSFKEEGYHIDSEKLYEYFLNFSVDTYYNVLNKESDIAKVNLISLWDFLYDYDGLKTKVNLDVLITTYNMFEEAIINY